MKGLTIRQPWASLIATGRKTIEVRSWRTHYRGTIVVVAGKRFDSVGRSLVTPAPRDAGALALVDLIDVRPFAKGDDESAAMWDPGDSECFAWVLANPRPLRSIVPVDGFLGIRDLASDICEMIGRQ